MAEPVRLLVVCLGNICRSPMAEGILRARIEASPLRGRVLVDSAGTGDWHVGRPPDHRAIATAASHGIDIAGLRARQFRRADAELFDWLLCADHDNLFDVRARLQPDAHSRAALLLEWSGVGASMDVPDPYFGELDGFEHSWRLLEQAPDGVVARLLSAPGGRG